MENAEEVFHFLEEFSKRKPKIIPQELNEYLAYVARTGDPVYQWSLVKCLFKEKLLNVITDFYETTPGIEIPPYPNVDPFNYDIMKNSLLERLDSFTSAPFTVQRICELLTYPRKQYNRVDKFMRAIEKNILVVSTREPGVQRHAEPENGEPMEPIVNGSDNNSEYNVDVEMEDMSWKENNEQRVSSDPQPSSSDTQITVDDIEVRLQAKQETPMEIQEKATTQYESVTPPELNVTTDEKPEAKPNDSPPQTDSSLTVEEKSENTKPEPIIEKPKVDIEMKPEVVTNTLVIPEIKVDDAEMTEQRLSEELGNMDKAENESVTKSESSDTKSTDEPPQAASEEHSSDSNTNEEPESKLISEVSTSSEESSSSSDNMDGNSNSPKTVIIDTPEDSSQSDTNSQEVTKEPEQPEEQISTTTVVEEAPKIESDNYSISDVNSELPQPDPEKTETSPPLETKEAVIIEETKCEDQGEVPKEKSEEAGDS